MGAERGERNLMFTAAAQYITYALAFSYAEDSWAQSHGAAAHEVDGLRTEHPDGVVFNKSLSKFPSGLQGVRTSSPCTFSKSERLNV